MVKEMASRRSWLLLVAVPVALGACAFGTDAPNGTDCTKNDECESKHCISNKCRPKPAFGGSYAGSTGASGSAGSSGGATDAGTD